MTAALLIALFLGTPLATACQEPVSTAVDASKPSAPAPSDPASAGSKLSGSTPSDPTRSGSASSRPTRTDSAKSDEQRILQNSINTALQLRLASRDAFERGLLPLSDYSDQLNLALKMELAVAECTGNENERQAAYVAHAGQLASAADQLRQFNQPAARGWRADLAQAELLTSQAAAHATANPENPASGAEALQQVSEQALAHYQLRVSDFENGLASLPDLSRAASYLAGDVTNPEASSAAIPGLMDYQTRTRQILNNTEDLARRGADGGRIDRVREAQFELSRNTMVLAGLSKDQPAMSTAFQAADVAAQELLASQSQLYDSGTVKLFDMARSFSQWQELHQQAGQFELDVPDSSNVYQQNELQHLIQLADRQTDLRGRNSADVTMVHSLKMLADLRQLPVAER